MFIYSMPRVGKHTKMLNAWDLPGSYNLVGPAELCNCSEVLMHPAAT